MKDLNNKLNQFGSKIDFLNSSMPFYLEFKSNIFFFIQDDKLRNKDFN